MVPGLVVVSFLCVPLLNADSTSRKSAAQESVGGTSLIVDTVDKERPNTHPAPHPAPSYAVPQSEPSPVAPRWDQGTKGNWQPLSEGTPVTAGDFVGSGDHLAVRVVAPKLHCSVTLAEGGGLLQVLAPDHAKQGEAMRFGLQSGVAFASLNAPPIHLPHPKKGPPPAPPIFATLEVGGMFVGTRTTSRVLLLAPDAKSKGDPAAIYAMMAEIEVAPTREALFKGEGMRVPPGHGVLVTGPNGIESPRPFDSEFTLLKPYPSLERIRGHVIK